MNRNTRIVIGVIVLIPVGLLVLWQVQGARLELDFVQALREGKVGTLHRDLQQKVWNDKELAEVEVIRVPEGAGKERALERHLQTAGRVFIPAHQYSYQAIISDSNTGIIHVFGYQRSEPQGWRWVTFHPSSMQQQMKRRLEQLDKMKKQRGK